MFLDTSIIIEIFRHRKTSKRFEDIYEHIENEPLFISIIQLVEISDWCYANKINPSTRIDQIKEIVNVVPLTESICLEGSKLKHEMREDKISKFSLFDGMILASARSIDQRLLTTDSDFRMAGEAIII